MSDSVDAGTVGSLPIEYPQRIRAVFFDVGFTLLAPHPSVPELVASVCAERGTPVRLDDLERHFPAAEALLRHSARERPDTWADEEAIATMWHAYFVALLTPCLPDATPDEVQACAHAVDAAFERAESYRLFPDALPVLRTLKEHGLTLGVISDWGVGLGLILRRHDLVQYFDFAVISAAVRHAKPDPHLFQTALERADAIPDYALHIGDSYTLDVLGARAAGVTPVLLDRPGRVDPAALDCAVVRDLYGLLDLLEIPRPQE